MNIDEHESLFRYIDGELSEEEQQKVEEQTAFLPNFAENLAAYREIDELLRAQLPPRTFQAPKEIAVPAAGFKYQRSVVAIVSVFLALAVALSVLWNGSGLVDLIASGSTDVRRATGSQGVGWNEAALEEFSSAQSVPRASESATPTSRQLHGVVRDFQDAPVENVAVTAYCLPYMFERETAQAKSLDSTLTGADGTWQLDYPDSATHLLLRAPGYVPVVLNYRNMVRNVPVSMEATLFNGEFIRGRVVDADGMPIPDVRVAPEDGLHFDELCSFSNEEGIFSLPKTELDGRQRIWLLHAEYAPMQTVASVGEDVQAVLKTGGTLRVRVAQHGAPAPGAAVFVISHDDNGLPFARTALSDQDGIALIEHLPGDTRVLVGAQTTDGYMAMTESETIRIAANELTQCEAAVTEPNFGIVTGVVQDAAGRPISGARVAVRLSNSERFEWPRYFLTDDNGLFQSTLGQGRNSVFVYGSDPFWLQWLDMNPRTVRGREDKPEVREIFTMADSPLFTLKPVTASGEVPKNLTFLPKLNEAGASVACVWRADVPLEGLQIVNSDSNHNEMSFYDPATKYSGWARWLPIGIHFGLKVTPRNTPLMCVVEAPTAELKGRIVDEDGNAVPHAVVNASYLSRIRRQSRRFPYVYTNLFERGVVESDIDGYFSVSPLLANREYTLRVNRTGYDAAILSGGNSGESNELNIMLHAQGQDQFYTLTMRRNDVEVVQGDARRAARLSEATALQ
ncbi:MAG: hypothetical protein KJ052_11290 [Candidatus Hydrogenedentes bacterium]|nr:hypothetical protein [Candidatus Hydrogenedentota bacterium]